VAFLGTILRGRRTPAMIFRSFSIAIIASFSAVSPRMIAIVVVS